MSERRARDLSRGADKPNTQEMLKKCRFIVGPVLQIGTITKQILFEDIVFDEKSSVL